MTVTLEAPHLPPPSEPEAPSSHSFAELVFRFRELGIVLALVIVVLVTAVNNSNFVSATNLQQIVEGAAIIGLLAIGETMVIVTRNVDLSVGSGLGLSAYAGGLLFERHPDVPILVDGSSIHPKKPLEGFSLTNVTGTCGKIATGEKPRGFPEKVPARLKDAVQVA